MVYTVEQLIHCYCVVVRTNVKVVETEGPCYVSEYAPTTTWPLRVFALLLTRAKPKPAGQSRSLRFRGGRPRLRRCAEFRSRMTSDSGSDNMAWAKEKQLTSSTPAAATTIVSDLALLCAAGLLCNCSCQDV